MWGPPNACHYFGLGFRVLGFGKDLEEFETDRALG